MKKIVKVIASIVLTIGFVCTPPTDRCTIEVSDNWLDGISCNFDLR